MSSNYWSSTTNANNPDNAWNVNFNNGNVNNNNKSNSLYVRAVRGGKCLLLSFESVYRAYLDCRKRKRGTINALKFEFGSLRKIFDLTLALQKGTYQPARSVCFVTTSPKLREIFAADFTDRIVHHLVVRELEKIWEPNFIFDSYASREEKGTHGAVHRLQNFMLKVTRNGKRRGWMVQLDIRSFFMSIDKDILFGMFERSLLKRLGGSEIPAMSAPADRLGFENRVGLPPGNGISASSKSSATDDPNAWVLLYLLHRIIYHHCERDFVFRGDPAMLDKVPPHKSLLKVGEGKGLPIGNLTSQFFANVYLNELDHFIKHELRCRHYVRYVDDFVLLAESPAILEQWVLQLTDFLEKRLLLTLKDGWRVKPVSEGADFLGYIVRPKYILVRNRVVHAMKDKLAGYHRKMVECLKDATGRTILKMKMGPEGTDELMQTLASYLGHFQHADSYNLKRTVFLGHPWLNEYFFFDGKRLFRRLRYPGVFRSFRAQVGFFRAMLKNTVLLVQVGLFMELYDDDAVSAGKALGLAVQKEKRRMAFSAGFPLRYERSTVEKLLALGREVAVIREDGAGKYVKERYVDDLYRIL